MDWKKASKLGVRVLSVALSLPLFVACSTMGETEPMVPPTPRANQHFIGVGVQPNPTRIVVTVPTLTVHGQNHVIFWDLYNASGQSYRFTHDGIAFKTAAGREQFDCAPVGSAGLRFRCLDKGTVRGTYEYGVTVEDASGRLSLDPLVVNN